MHEKNTKHGTHVEQNSYRSCFVLKQGDVWSGSSFAWKIDTLPRGKTRYVYDYIAPREFATFHEARSIHPPCLQATRYNHVL